MVGISEATWCGRTWPAKFKISSRVLEAGPIATFPLLSRNDREEIAETMGDYPGGQSIIFPQSTLVDHGDTGSSWSFRLQRLLVKQALPHMILELCRVLTIFSSASAFPSRSGDGHPPCRVAFHSTLQGIWPSSSWYTITKSRTLHGRSE